MSPKVIPIRKEFTLKAVPEKMVILDDGTPAYSDCLICRHYLKGGYYKHWKCEAFPKGIPLNIWKGDIKHDKLIVGQGNDLVFIKRRIKKKSKLDKSPWPPPSKQT